jgi:diaminohydroxyphosphoribosylaminopyrimidine deaminase / 5-amino-6-(5-phosphoribosylamino)uracil reductase
MLQHEIYMQRCLELALLGAGSVSPNPMVGSVLVFEGKIIAEGYHQKYGEPHAEANAIDYALKNLDDAEAKLKASTLYVNLEPCSHFGKRPPCADLIIRYHIPKVVVGCRDPFDQVNGKGIEKLKEAGIHVIENVLQAECLDLNRRFFTRIEKQRPYIILKWAETANGYFAPASPAKKWISSDASKKLVHKWRSEEDAVLVGKNTALIDDPQLNVRETAGRNPVRIILDRHLSLPQTLKVFDQSQDTVVFNFVKTDIVGRIKYLRLDDFDTLLPQLIAFQLYLMDIQSIIIEGGLQTLELFIKAGLWDEARIITGKENWEDGIKAPAISGKLISQSQLSSDIITILYNPNK